MRFSVLHETVYSYESPVTLGAHRVRLTPRADAGRLARLALEIDPAPILRREVPDGHGNRATLLEFEGRTDRLRIVSGFDIDTKLPEPVRQPLPPLPWALRAPEHAPYVVQAAQGPRVTAFTRDLMQRCKGAPLAFLDELTSVLYRRTDRRIRETGFARTPEQTLQDAQGACRDLAVLFLACCRGLGIPGRFASGYQAQAESVDGKRHLHAWPEVWLPGAGWTGFDPTHGVRTRDGHVALSAAPTQEETMPVEGGYYGPPTGARLDYRVEIDVG